jgi:hypothetical protein
VSERDRFQREDPPRIYPRRNMSEAFRADDPWSARPPFEEQQRPEGPSSNPSRGPATEGVDNAYRVVDDQMREGQWRARWHHQRGSDWRYGANGWPYGWSYGGRQPDGIVEQMTRMYLDMINLVSTVMAGLARPPFYANRGFEPPPGREFHHSRAGRYPDVGVRVEVSSDQEAYVALDLKEHSSGESLVVAPLRTTDTNKPPISDVSLYNSNGVPVLCIRIPNGHPSGV